MIWKCIDSAEEASAFIQWAREKYIPFSPIEGIWHPVAQAECVLINTEKAGYRGRWPVVDNP